VDKSGARFFEAELYRLRGDLLRSDGTQAEAEAEAEYERAIEIARAQKAKSWELRASTSLARLRVDQGRRAQALELLTPIYSSFTEGFGTRDLQEARILLDTLNGSEAIEAR
jgi:predicted ATPase